LQRARVAFAGEEDDRVERGSGDDVPADAAAGSGACADTCTGCGERLSAATVSWRRPRDGARLTPLVR